MAREAAFARARERVTRLCADDTGADARALRAVVRAEIDRVVPAEAYVWMLTDPETEVGADPLALVPCLSELPRLVRLKYLTRVNRWTDLGRPPVATLEQATGGQLSVSPVWRGLLCRYGVRDVASTVFRDRHGCWGFLDLWRTEPSAFTAAEIDFLADIAPQVTRGLRGCAARTFMHADGGARAGEPLVLLLSPELQVRGQTPETDRQLRTLLPPQGSDPPVPAIAYNVAAQLLAVEQGVDGHPPTARVSVGDGRWLTARAARLDSGAPPSEAPIAVALEPTTTRDRLSLFARAHALSARERDVLDRLVTGADTRDLAAALFVSEHTVQDHVKSVLTKTGLHSRRDLVARVSGG